MELKDFLYVSEFLKDRLYFATVQNNIIPQSNKKYYYFSIDNELIYENYYLDFGPLNLSMLYRYCIKLSNSLKTFPDKIIVHCTTENEKKRSNAAFLIASFVVLYLNKTVEEALTPLVQKHIPAFLPFRDAAITESIFNISLKDCLQAIHRAYTLGFFRLDDFNFVEYEHYERAEKGDMNWIIPQKFLAFSSPESHVDRVNSQDHTPEYYFSYFKSNNVTNVIRLNAKSYDANRFVDSGFQHNDLYFLDGTTPSDAILGNFFKITENAKGAIAVHCKAGLGRTGSVIACYLMKHYRFNVVEAIAWVRICRPGSIIGCQQKWLDEKKTQLWIEGNRYRKKFYGNPDFIPTHKYGIYSNEIRNILYDSNILQDEPLYEPAVLQKPELSKIVRDIGAVNLDDKEDVYQSKKTDSNVMRNSRNRTNVSQGEKLVQIKVSRKDIRTPSTPFKYSYTGRPLIIRGAAKNWTALKVFDYEFFKTLNNVTHMSECQFINYNNEFGNLNAALNIDSKRINMANKTNWWYFGWSVCDPLAVKILRQYYTKPHFLSLTSENYIVDWIFMGTSGHGAVLHVDNVNFPSWQAQIKGTKRWKLQSPVECLYLCQNTYYIDVFPGDIIVLDTNLWYHATEVISKEISITIGAEYD